MRCCAWRSAAALASAVVACGDGAAAPEEPDAAAADAVVPWIEIGGGRDRFEPMAREQSVSLILGSQGGWMMFFALRGGGFDPGNVEDPADERNPLVVLRGTARGQPVALLHDRRGFRRASADALELAGLPLVLYAEVDPHGLVERPLDVEVVVTDLDGREAAGAAVVTPVAAEGAL